jgi:ElaB/YqjD/DUF883 family membrane-anchored ribosome-binding protein
METEIPISSTETQSARPDMRTRSSQTSGLRDELSHLKSDLDALMLHASTLSESELREARDRIVARFSSMRHAAKGIAEQAGRQLTQGRDVTADYVRERPLQSVALAAGVGMLIGALLRRD